MKNRGHCWIVLAVLLLGGCLPKQPLVDINAAENIRRTSDGRIFVSGLDALYELHRDASGTVTAVPVVTDESGSDTGQCVFFNGVAQLNDWLFVVCGRLAGFSFRDFKFTYAGTLVAYSLLDGRVVTAAALEKYQVPNGLDALTEDNAILVADEDFLAHGGVSKVKFDFSSGEPELQEYRHQWIGRDQGVTAANGVRVWNGSVYLTDIGQLKRVPLDVDGEPLPAQSLYRHPTVLDDFDVFCNGFLVADYVKGRLVYVPADGSPATPTQGGLAFPSAVLTDATPLFEPGDILVTETMGVTPGAGRVQLVKQTQLGVDECVQ